jgi:hypothetical protein
MYRLLGGLALVGLGAGCSVELGAADLQKWVGRPAATLRQEWGPPTREVVDGAQRVLVYEQLDRPIKRDFDTKGQPRERDPHYGQLRAIEAAERPGVYVRSYIFWVDAEGAIVRTEVRQP